MLVKYLKTYDDKCIGCGLCMTACSTLYFKEDNPELSAIKVIKQSEEDFKLDVCNQCTVCVAECPTQALTINKGVVYLNKNICIGCYACVAVCPTNTMYTYHLGVEPIKCNSCGVCVKDCPADALEIVTEEVDDEL